MNILNPNYDNWDNFPHNVKREIDIRENDYYKKKPHKSHEEGKNKPPMLYCRLVGWETWFWLFRPNDIYSGGKWILNDTRYKSSQIAEVDEELSDPNGVSLWQSEIEELDLRKN